MPNNSAAAYEENLIGPAYDYASYIRSPDELGVGTSGSISQIKKNYVAMGQYFDLILTGKSNASKEGKDFGPQNSGGDGRVLGPSFFVDTFAKCKPMRKVGDQYIYDKKKDKNLVPRSIYHNFKPTGKIVIANAGGDLRGMFPGILSNLDKITPGKMMDAVSQGDSPPCYQIRMPVYPTENNNYARTQVRWVSKDDIKNIDECAFVINNSGVTSNSDYKDLYNTKQWQNPVSGKICSRKDSALYDGNPPTNPNEFLPQSPQEEGFSNISTIPKDSLVEIYIGALSILLLLLFLQIYKRHN